MGLAPKRAARKRGPNVQGKIQNAQCKGASFLRPLCILHCAFCIQGAFSSALAGRVILAKPAGKIKRSSGPRPKTDETVGAAADRMTRRRGGGGLGGVPNAAAAVGWLGGLPGTGSNSAAIHDLLCCPLPMTEGGRLPLTSWSLGAKLLYFGRSLGAPSDPTRFPGQSLRVNRERAVRSCFA